MITYSETTKSSRLESSVENQRSYVCRSFALSWSKTSPKRELQLKIFFRKIDRGKIGKARGSWKKP
jgi:hypothetical protein